MTFHGSLSAPYHDSGRSSLTHSAISPDAVKVPCDCSRYQLRIVESLLPRYIPAAS